MQERDVDNDLEDAVESILGNASLTDELNDDAADILIRWGIDSIRKIFLEASGEEDFEQILYMRSRATRKMMRSVNNFLAKVGESNIETESAALEKISALLFEAYGGNVVVPNAVQKADFLRNLSSYPQEQAVYNLRSLFEDQEG